MKQKFKFTIIRPGGNDTALVKGIFPKNMKNRINDAIEKKYSNVEQVGFFQFDEKKNIVLFEMAGNELSGNALRAVTYALLNGKEGSLEIKSSGTRKIIKTGISKNGFVYTEIPIPESNDFIKNVPSNLICVSLQGIKQIIVFNYKTAQKQELKQLAKKIIVQNNLLNTYPCTGVMFIEKVSNNFFNLEPVVWIRDVKTLFYETSCASGSAAIALWKSLNNKSSQQIYKIKQPSKDILTVTIIKKNSELRKVVISGYVNQEITWLSLPLSV